jgi:acyl dehydratase
VRTLWYRYVGNDRNPPHADPQTARQARLKEPILIGQNVLGFACRALVHRLFDDDPAWLRSISGRFAAAGYNGEVLRTEMWHARDTGVDERGDDVVLFRVANERGDVLVDRGRATVARPAQTTRADPWVSSI